MPAEGDGPIFATIDTDVLLEFMREDRLGLLGRNPAFQFIVSDTVYKEVENAGQKATLDRAISRDYFRRSRSSAPSSGRKSHVTMRLSAKAMTSGSGTSHGSRSPAPAPRQPVPRQTRPVSRPPGTRPRAGREPPSPVPHLRPPVAFLLRRTSTSRSAWSLAAGSDPQARTGQHS